MARSFDGVSRTISVILTGLVSVVVRFRWRSVRYVALLLGSLHVRGGYLRMFSGLSEDQRAGPSAAASILRAPVGARL